ncbi:MAG: substrate-binding domain-containing protein [Casimicrobiaceae bacterium]
MIGVAGDPVGGEILRATEARLSAGGVGLLISLAAAHAAVDTCARALAGRGAEGILFIGTGVSPELAQWCSDRGLPAVDASRQTAAGAMPAAEGSAWRRGLDLAERYLRDLGHRRIGVLTRSGEADAERPAPVHRDSAIIEQGIDQANDPDSVCAAVARLLKHEVTAIVAASDTAAAAALRECRGRALHVPQQVSVVGWGDTGLARCLSPTLTSMRVPASEVGQAAADCLLAALAGREYTWPELPVKLVIRESSAPART